MNVELVDQNFIDAGTPLNDGTGYTLVQPVNMIAPFTFSGSGAGINFNGNNLTITVLTGSWSGLFNQPITVSNTGILSALSLSANCGWFFAPNVGGTATNCYSTGTIGSGGGGIFGTNSSGMAIICYSTGNQTDSGAGGIFGSSSAGNASNCYSTGTIGVEGGGILGTYSGGTVGGCYSTGAIGNSGGGIFGSHGIGNVSECYSTGSIGSNGGGIFGQESIGTVDNCYSIGTIGSNGGGIVGYLSSSFPTNCYVTAGGQWSDAAANAPGALTGFSTVWISYNSVINTPYLLAANPQAPSSNNSLSVVTVNGSTLTSPYAYTVTGSYLAFIPVNIITEEPHAVVSIQALTGAHDISGSLTLTGDLNSFTIQVTAMNGTIATYPLDITNLPAPMDILIDQAFVNAPALLLNNTSYKVVADLTMSAPFPFLGNGSGTIIDGSGHTITATMVNWPGLFGYAVDVSNLGILSSMSTEDSAGWFFAAIVGGSATNCYSTGSIGGNNGGGIFGSTSNGTALNCYSTGAIGVVSSGGGIFGSYGSGTATNCYSIGTIGLDGGGIFGSYGSGTATNCYSTGIIGPGGDGIFGQGSTGTTTNCYFINGGQWSDVSANIQLTGVSGEAPPPTVWFSYNNVINTPYLLVENPQDPSSNNNLSVVTVNGSTLTSPYAYTVTGSYLATIPVNIITEEPHAVVSIQDLSGAHDISGSLTLAGGLNSFTIEVAAMNGLTANYPLNITNPLPIVLIDQAFVDANTPLANNTIYKVVAPLTMTAPFPFLGNGSGTVIDGSGHTITATTDNWPGLFSYAVDVSNLGILSSLLMNNNAGWFFAQGIGGSATNCYSTGTISSSNSGATNFGGIFGYNSSGSATNCYSTGAIGEQGGGIFGAYSGGTATNCYSTGSIGILGGGGVFGGGIFGAFSGGTATNCYSTGSIILGGGIFGIVSQGTATNCYSMGVGDIFGPSSTGTTTNCYPVNGGRWSDVSANAQLTGVSGEVLPPAVWFSYNNVINTPYLLVENPQDPSSNNSLSVVTVNGSTLTSPYAYTIPTHVATVPVHIVTEEPHAVVSIQSLSGAHDISGSLTVVTGLNSFTIQVAAMDGTIANYPLNITNPPDIIPCFPTGSRILTASGYKTVESLVQNELVLTADGRQVPVKIYRKQLSVTNSHTAPYRIPKGVFGVANDLVLSPDHAFQIRKGLWMLPKAAALLSPRVEQIDVGKPITYYHLKCPNYAKDNLVANGTVVESYAGKSSNLYMYNEKLKGYTRSVAVNSVHLRA